MRPITVSSSIEYCFRVVQLSLLVSGLMFCGCQQSNESTSAENVEFTQSALNDAFQYKHESEINPDDADITMLFLGNSHTAAHNVPGIVAKLIKADGSDQAPYSQTLAYGDAFLADHVESKRSMEVVNSRKWNVIVLQAQKYSTTGRYSYPHDAAAELTAIGKEQGAIVVMFPEWGRRGHDEEGARVQKLHEEIAAETGAVVSPVGLAWDLARKEKPKLALHAQDGNHSSPAGAYLTGCVLYATITGRDPRGLDENGGVRVTKETRAFLQDVAYRTVLENKKD